MEKQDFLDFVNPATGEKFGQVAMATPEAVRAAMSDMRLAFPAWSQKTAEERVRILRKLQEVMIDAADEITAVLNLDCGKTRQDGLAELFVTTDLLHMYLKHTPRWLRRRRVSSGLFIFKHSLVERSPYGVVAVIAPWNYPFALSMPAVIGALLAGNTVILKPSEVTGAVGVLIEDLFRRVPELSPYVRVLHGDGSVGAEMVRARPDYIFLTGSTLTGKKVSQAAAEHLIPLACELGGKDSMLVLEDANLPEAARWGVWGAFFNTGQTCMSVERVYVVEPLYDEFVRRAVEETEKMKAGYSPDIDSPNHMGPITDPRQIETIERQMADALAKGARVLTGGKRNGMFYEPTVVVDVDHSMLLMRDETFGPIIPIMKVRDEAEAIRMANDNDFGLGASIWSEDVERAMRVGRQVQAASVVINDTIAQFAIAMLPFGGIKQSGYGRTHGQEGLIQFTRPYAYAVGPTPIPWDVATIGRNPGNYRLLDSIMHFVFGVTARQRLEPVAEAMRDLPKMTPKARQAMLRFSAASVMTGALAFAAFWFGRKRRSL